MVNFEGSLGLNQTGGVRQKRWTPRVKSGCSTCRSRRVKCDETRPRCKRCVRTGNDCPGYAENLAGREIRPLLSTNTATRDHDAVNLNQFYGSREVNIGLASPDWELFDGIRYYFQVIKPSLTEETSEIADPPFHIPQFSAKKFLSQVVCDQISRVSKARGRLLETGEDYAMAGSWERHYRYTADYIHIANGLIQGDEKSNQAFGLSGIFHLLVMDLYVKGALWRAHLGGFLAYAHLRKGLQNPPRPTRWALNIGIGIALSANTTSPAANQIKGLDNFTDDELKSALEFTTVGNITAPADLLVIIANVTRLRVVVAGGEFNDEYQARLEERLNATWDTDARKWAKEKFATNKLGEGLMCAQIHAVAARLYGILALPAAAIATWAGRSAQVRTAYPNIMVQGPKAYENIRAAHRKELVALLKRAQIRFDLRTALTWATIVAGVAVSNSDADDQILVAGAMLAIWEHPATICTFMMAVEKLQAFWASGSTGWEDCFDEPVACIPAP